MAFQLIAFDVDGTLLDSKKQIRQDTLLAIREAQAAGKLVALSTGRNPAEISVLEEELGGVRYRICCSGGMVWDAVTDELLLNQTIPDEIVRSILQLADDYDVMLHMLSRRSVVQRSCVEHMEDYHMEVYRPLYRRIATQLNDLRDEWMADPWPVNKLNLYFRHEEDRAAVEARMTRMPLELVHAEHSSLECTPAGVGKGTGLLGLCKVLAIPVEETIAVGDADNDIDILKTAGLGIAMGNAKDNVKAAADVIVRDNDHGGCADAIRNWLLT